MVVVVRVVVVSLAVLEVQEITSGLRWMYVVVFFGGLETLFIVSERASERKRLVVMVIVSEPR